MAIQDVDRQAFLYENVIDGQGRRYGIKVLTGVYAASRKIVGLGMGCKDPGEIYERWRRAVDKPIDPVLVESGPVHEEVHIGAELEKIGLSMLPAPVEEPGFSGDTRVTGPFITEAPRAASAMWACTVATFGRPIVCWRA